MPENAAVDALVEAARRRLDRVRPEALASEMAAGALVVDTRPVEQRLHDGELPGAVVIDRNVLEWRLDPTSRHRIPEAADRTRRIIIVCNEGYSSSLAAATLRDLGLGRATDLVGGFQAWSRLVRPPAHEPLGAPSDHLHGTDECWLRATLPFVRAHLPPPPAHVVDVGCGHLGGFVPGLRALGYDALGIDPEAPDGAEFQRVAFEHAVVTEPADVVIACTSLHHVADLDGVVERIVSALKPGGVVVVVEWAWEWFDEETARWCFDRLGSDDGGHDGWLRRHRGDWAASGQPWDAYIASWAEAERLHRGMDILRALERRFVPLLLATAPHFFPDLAGTADDEQSAIDTAQIRATSLRYVGRPKSRQEVGAGSSG
jgi:rhodanese-related sulfurtransferase